MSFLYFAYGSNLLRQRLVLNNPTAVFKCIGKLQEYSLHFIRPGESTRWRVGAASIEECPEGEVWGVVWEINDSDSDSLDAQEGIYDRLKVQVTSTEGITYTCRTYIMKKGILDKNVDNRPSPQYKDVIIRGAVQNNLPSAYLSYLQAIEDNGFTGRLGVYEDVLKLLGEK